MHQKTMQRILAYSLSPNIENYIRPEYYVNNPTLDPQSMGNSKFSQYEVSSTPMERIMWSSEKYAFIKKIIYFWLIFLWYLRFQLRQYIDKKEEKNSIQKDDPEEKKSLPQEEYDCKYDDPTPGLLQNCLLTCLVSNKCLNTSEAIKFIQNEQCSSFYNTQEYIQQVIVANQSIINQSYTIVKTNQRQFIIAFNFSQ